MKICCYPSISDKGIFVVELSYLLKMIDSNMFDTVYHEHLCYFTLKSITYLLERFNLYPFEIKYSPISGGSFVIYFSKKKKV